jgi:hypothetical protein
MKSRFLTLLGGKILSGTPGASQLAAVFGSGTV